MDVQAAEASSAVVMAALHPPVEGGAGEGGTQGGAEEEGDAMAA